jgi:hypothetical protein
MRQGPRDVTLSSIQVIDPDHGWVWNSKDIHLQGYFGWYVLEGVLIAEGPQLKWEIPPAHVFLHPVNTDPISLTIQSGQEARLSCISYLEASGARLPAQCRRIGDPVYLEVLIQKAHHRLLRAEMWEANTILQAVLDEVFFGDAVMPHKKQYSEAEQAHRITQNKLKTLNWSHTKRLL